MVWQDQGELPYPIFSITHAPRWRTSDPKDVNPKDHVDTRCLKFFMAPSFLIMLEHSSIQQRFTGCLLCIGPAGQVCAGVWEKLQTYRTHTHTQGIVTKLRTEAASVVHPAVSQRPRRRWVWRASQFSGWWHPLMPGTQKDSDNSAVFAAVEGTVASPRGFVNLSELPSASGLFFLVSE